MRTRYAAICAVAISMISPGQLHSQQAKPGRNAQPDAFDGSAASRDPGEEGLRWLVKQQKPDGSWLLDGAGDSWNISFRTASTALAVLSLLRLSHSPDQGEYGEPVADGLAFIQDQMKAVEHGYRAGGDDDRDAMYCHAIITMAICESLAKTKDEKLRPLAMARGDTSTFIRNSPRARRGVVTSRYVTTLPRGRAVRLQ